MKDFVSMIDYGKTMSPVEYIKYASQFNHTFDNMEINSITNNKNKYIITGTLVHYSTHFIKSKNGYYKSPFKIVIVKNKPWYKTLSEHEGSFNFTYNGEKYNIDSLIDNPIVKYQGKPEIVKRNFELSEASTKLGIPEQVVKVALVGISIEI
jgi:hypothetical protein